MSPSDGLSIHKGEFDAIQAILAEDGIEASAEGVRAIWKQAVRTVLDNRDWWIVVFRTEEGMNLPFGLYATEGAAIKVVNENRLAGLSTWQVGVVHINNATKQLQYVEEH